MSDFVSRQEQTSPAKLADMPGDHWTEIFLHLPPQPHILLRVSHVCRSWRRLTADPGFLRSFRARHNDTPPLAGVFHNICYEGARRFTPITGDGEDPLPLRRGFTCPAHWHVFDSRHGRVLFHALAHGAAPPVLILWDPVTRRCEKIGMPPDWAVYYNYDGKLGGSVVCMAGDDADGRHGDCRSGPFMVVLMIGREPRAMVSVYSSEDGGGWNKAISFDGLPMWAEVVPKPCVVIGDTLYQAVSGSNTLAFDLRSSSFTMVPNPPETKWMDVQIVRVDGGRLGLVVANNVEFSLQLWVWKGADDWVQRWRVRLDTLKPLSATAQPGVVDLGAVNLIGACDYGNAIFLWTRLGSFMLQLDTMELKELSYDSTMTSGSLYPYESFFAPVQVSTIPS
ncbi:hypothetical protein HU200_022538 [Digitaria exilis]|uniref:F-box domain-containing protein n=1 Tax=Digitaria exilis TaxID=1010633 RepID=A0A835C755_9POAL|nr:hypothetical protein HU200_022538 [Digitaria exilis]